MIIGIAGKARHGKDSCADFIVERFGFCKKSFADPLKRAAAELFGLPLETFMSGDREKKHDYYGISPRQILQILGTECVRENFGQDFWCRRAALDMIESKNYVFADSRFDNECNWIRSKGGLIIHVIRPGIEEVGVPGHLSEIGPKIKLGDVVIVNDGDLNQLFSRVVESVRCYV